MPDFFTRLAERTLGLTSTIQPMIPSLFAPGAPLLDAEEAADQHGAIAERQPGHVVPESAVPSAIQPAAPPHNDAPSTPRSVLDAPERLPAPTIERAAFTPPHNEPPSSAEQRVSEPSTASKRVSAFSAEVTTPTPQHASRPATSNTLPTSVQHAAVEPTLHASRVPSRPLSTEQAAAHAVFAQPPLLVPVGDEQPPRRDEHSTHTTPGERFERVAQEPSIARLQPLPRSPEASAAPPAPQIQVAIGRIEVRAMTPPPAATPPPKPAPAPRMSLDDYLRSQNGGRR